MNIDAQDFDNENLIVFYQKQRTSGLAFFGDRGGIKNNNGNVCVFNNIFQVKYGIDGSGSVLLLKKIHFSTFLETMSFQKTRVYT